MCSLDNVWCTQERRFSHILSAYSRGQPVFKTEDSTKALNQLVNAVLLSGVEWCGVGRIAQLSVVSMWL
jgi:hypothetical protein